MSCRILDGKCIRRNFLPLQVEFDFFSLGSGPLFFDCNFGCAGLCFNTGIGKCDGAGIADAFSRRHGNLESGNRFFSYHVCITCRQVMPGVGIAFRLLQRGVLIRHIGAILIQFHNNRIRPLRSLSALPSLDNCHIDGVGIVIGDGRLCAGLILPD